MVQSSIADKEAHAVIEEWKDIPGFDGGYQISNLGNVRSCLNCHRGKKFVYKPRRLSFTKDGYIKVRLLYAKRGIDCCYKVHRLVAEAFVSNPYNKETVNHIDGDKTNNSFDNLEWADRSEQLVHAYSHGLRKAKKGSENSQSKLTEEQVNEIRSLYRKGSRVYSSVKLGKMFNVSHNAILSIVKNKTYVE